MTKCAVCREETCTFTWQPTLGDDTLTFYLPGNHIRGFIAVHIGDACIAKLRAGETVTFTHRKVQYWADNKKFDVVPQEQPIYVSPSYRLNG